MNSTSWSSFRGVSSFFHPARLGKRWRGRACHRATELAAEASRTERWAAKKIADMILPGQTEVTAWFSEHKLCASFAFPPSSDCVCVCVCVWLCLLLCSLKAQTAWDGAISLSILQRDRGLRRIYFSFFGIIFFISSSTLSCVIIRSYILFSVPFKRRRVFPSAPL
jgi:hypothetical protein